MSDLLFVTGCYRSGTTLTEKLLHLHPDVSVASQPFPVLLFYAKERFLAEVGVERRYPLDHQFRETAYRPDDFTAFLENLTLDAGDIAEVAQRLDGYTEGLWTRQVLDVLPAVAPGSFLSVWQDLSTRLASALGRPNVSVVGTKEVLGEEFVPFILRSGGHVVHVLRDPRDMITSLNMRVRYNLTGDPRPVLYSVRLWRKSVAYALADETRGANVIRYEDVAADPAGTMAPIARNLGVADVSSSDLISGLKNQSGGTWAGNSSFDGLEGVSTAPIGRYRTRLPDDTIRYIETIAAPEMKVLEYERTGLPSMTTAELLEYEEPTPATHKAFDPGYSRAPSRIADEERRLQMLSGSPEESETREWFTFPSAFRRLSDTPRD